jgi:hypothetical protein
MRALRRHVRLVPHPDIRQRKTPAHRPGLSFVMKLKLLDPILTLPLQPSVSVGSL